MPLLACDPILINPTDTYGRNAVIPAELTLTSYGRSTPTVETIQVNLRTNASGKVVDYDLSPLVAEIARKHFTAGIEPQSYVIDNGYNAWKFSFSVNGSTISSGDIVFGAGNIVENRLLPPYLLRRNTAAIHAYIGLNMTIAQWQRFNMTLYDDELKNLRSISGSAAGVATYSFFRNGYPEPGNYYLSGNQPFLEKVWNDSNIWRDTDVWIDAPEIINADTVIYPLVIHPDPRACIRAGGKIYVRYWNSVGAWSYALLDVLRNDLKAKTEYADAWRLDANPVNGRIYGDRVQTDKEMTYTITAGRDGLDRLDVDELRDMQRAYCVQVWDVDRGVWRDCYVQDATTQNTGGRGQEMTFTIEMPHEYTFTR